jgi:hypothetical protein
VKSSVGTSRSPRATPRSESARTPATGSGTPARTRTWAYSAVGVVLSAIACWADAHDAPRLYLQVEQSNAAARRLYDAAGFTQLATYHYHVRATHTDR